jgi:capsular exopolysaccharide synthesis family protein
MTGRSAIVPRNDAPSAGRVSLPQSRTNALIGDQTSQSAGWQQPAVEQHGLRRFLQTLREGAWLVLATVAVTTSLAVAYVMSTDDVYEAQADMLITPIPADDQLLAGLGLITESVDPTLDVQTAVQLIRTNEVAERAKETLGLDASADDVLADVKVEPLGQSNVVGVIADQPTAKGAADLANAFGDAAVEQRSEELENRIDAILPRLSTQAETAPGDLGLEYAQQVAQLEGLRATGDPTIRVENPAQLPESASWPRPSLTIALSLLAGLALGIIAALASRLLDPRLRREEQLRGLYRLPILSRIPRERRGDADTPLAWNQLSAGAIEGYRTLRATLNAARRGETGSRSILITGAAPSEGKTTTAINLATALSLGGANVILIEADLRRPAIGGALGVKAEKGIVSVLVGETTLAEALVQAEGHSPNLRLLLADHSGPWLAELFSHSAAETLVEEAGRHADFVVVDSPPLTEVIDALPLARQVDQVVMVVRLGKTYLGRIKELGELLAGTGITPAGFVVVGGARQSSYYYAYGEPAGASRRAKRQLNETPQAAAQQRV